MTKPVNHGHAHRISLDAFGNYASGGDDKISGLAGALNAIGAATPRPLAAALYTSAPDTSITTGVFTPGGGEVFQTAYHSWTLSTAFGASGTFDSVASAGNVVAAADAADSFYMVGFQIGFGTPIPIAEAPYLEIAALSAGSFYVMGYTDHRVADVASGDIDFLYVTEFIAPAAALSIYASLQTVDAATDPLSMYVVRLGAFG